MLYWFRTPPHVKVGRDAFDPDTIRLLESQHPDITFDWIRMLKEPPQPAAPEEDRRREVREAREARQARRRREQARVEVPQASPFQDAPVTEVLRTEAEAAGEERGEPAGEGRLAATVESEGDPLRALDEGERVELGEVFGATGAGVLAEAALEPSDEAVSGFVSSEMQVPAAGDMHPLHELLGSEGLMRLRARHAALLARIAEMPDEARRDALGADAALIDPDAWLTPEEARAGLETYEARYEALRSALGVRRKRRRRRRKTV